MAWYKTIQKISPHVVKIQTPSGHGTGFFFGRNANGAIAAIATAAHVVQQADDWKQPIKVSTETELVYLNDTERVIFIDRARDSAVITFKTTALPSLPTAPIKLCERDAHFMVGTPIGWMGYPGLAPRTCASFADTSAPKKRTFTWWMA